MLFRSDNEYGVPASWSLASRKALVLATARFLAASNTLIDITFQNLGPLYEFYA